MATGIDWTGRRAQATRARTTTHVHIGLPRPTDFATVQYFVQLPPIMFGFFWVSRHRSIILAKKWKHFPGRFWEIPGNVLKLELLKMLIDHKNTSVFFQAVSGMSSWSFSYRWTQYQWEKTATKHQFIALLGREEKSKDHGFFGYFFLWVPIFDPTLVQYFIQIPHIIFCCPLSAYDKWWFEQKKITTFSGKAFSSELP